MTNATPKDQKCQNCGLIIWSNSLPGLRVGTASGIDDFLPGKYCVCDEAKPDPPDIKPEETCCDSPCHHCPYFNNDCTHCHDFHPSNPPETKPEEKWLTIGYKIYCLDHKRNRDITCDRCNRAFEFNCRADAKEAINQDLVKQFNAKNSSTPQPLEDWAESIKSVQQKSKTTYSGWEVVYDTDTLIDFIRSLLARQREEARQKLISEIREWIKNNTAPKVDIFNARPSDLLSHLDSLSTKEKK